MPAGREWTSVQLRGDRWLNALYSTLQLFQEDERQDRAGHQPRPAREEPAPEDRDPFLLQRSLQDFSERLRTRLILRIRAARLAENTGTHHRAAHCVLDARFEDIDRGAQRKT